MEDLYNKLIRFSRTDHYPMHMPGHKRNIKKLYMENPYAIDITEIEGFDNLHQPEGILMKLSERISSLYNAEESFLLVNGSTAGILAGISAATKKGDFCLIARNSHKSVYHAVTLMDLKPVYIYPERIVDLPIHGGILPSKVEDMLIKYPEIRLVVITSPTYEGVVSDIRTIAETVHRHGALLLVDEAHGAHFGFHKDFPKSAVTLGADIVIQSLHKTLPAFTQTAVLHLNRMELETQIKKYLSIYQSSSPSYILMAGADQCIKLLEEDADNMFQAFSDELKEFYASMEDLVKLKLVNKNIIGDSGVYDLDSTKLTIISSGTKMTGHQLNFILREKYHIDMEMEARDYVLGMTSICDTKDGFDRLGKALHMIDRKDLYQNGNEYIGSALPEMNRAIAKLTPSEAMQKEFESILVSESSGRISAAFVSIYPPGIPALVPGEIIQDRIIEYLNQARESGLTITGLCGDDKEKIDVVC